MNNNFKRSEVFATKLDPQHVKISIKYTRRNQLWAWLKQYCDEQWLKSHGWIQVRDGWLLPHWHPKLAGKTRHKKGMVYFSTPGPSTWKYPTINRRGATSERVPSLRAEDHLSKVGPIKEIGEPYDLNHALNSQRAHTDGHPGAAMLPTPEQDAPAFPSYVAWRPFQFILPTLGNLAGIVSAMLWPNAWCYLAVTAAVLFIAASCIVAAKVRREWELDWAESRLMRAKKN